MARLIDEGMIAQLKMLNIKLYSENSYFLSFLSYFCTQIQVTYQ